MTRPAVTSRTTPRSSARLQPSETGAGSETGKENDRAPQASERPQDAPNEGGGYDTPSSDVSSLLVAENEADGDDQDIPAMDDQQGTLATSRKRIDARLQTSAPGKSSNAGATNDLAPQASERPQDAPNEGGGYDTPSSDVSSLLVAENEADGDDQDIPAMDDQQGALAPSRVDWKTLQASSSVCAFEVSRKDLLDAVGGAATARASKNAIPILGNVLIMAAAETGQISCSCTNLHVGVTCMCQGDVRQSGAITVDARLLQETLANLFGEIVRVSGDAKRQTMTITCDLPHRFGTTNDGTERTQTVTLPGIAAKEFPTITDKDHTQPLGVFPVVPLITGIERVSVAAASDDYRPVLNGILLRFETDVIQMVAADGFRLHMDVIANTTGVTSDLIVPVSAMRTLMSLVFRGTKQRAAPPLSIFTAAFGNQLIFEQGTTTVVTRLIEGTFPNFERVIPAPSRNRAIVQKEALKQAVRLAAIFASTNQDAVKLTFTQGNLCVSANGKETGHNESPIPAIVELADDALERQYTVNWKFLNDAIACIQTDQIAIEFTTSDNSLVLKDMDDNARALFLIMLMNPR